MSISERIYGSTERLILRQFSEQDIEPFYSYRTNPVVAKFQPWGNYQYNDAVSFVRQQITNVPGQPGTWFQFAIVLVETNQFIGDCALHTLLDEPRIVEIGFTLAEEHQGMGYASEAIKLLFNFVFEQLHKHKVIAFTDVRNEGSIRLLERVGMRREGHLLENYYSNGQWVNEYQYSLLQSEWINLKK